MKERLAFACKLISASATCHDLLDEIVERLCSIATAVNVAVKTKNEQTEDDAFVSKFS